MQKRDEQTPGRRNPQPQSDDFGRPDEERQRQPGSEQDTGEEEEER
jgi:hypothetical protein